MNRLSNLEILTPNTSRSLHRCHGDAAAAPCSVRVFFSQARCSFHSSGFVFAQTFHLHGDDPTACEATAERER